MITDKKPRSGIRVSMPAEVYEEKKQQISKDSFEKGQESIIRILHGFATGEFPRESIQVKMKVDGHNGAFNYLLDRLNAKVKADYVR